MTSCRIRARTASMSRDVLLTRRARARGLRVDLGALRVRPVHVEELAAGPVDALVGVSAEVVALGLEQVGGEPRRAVAVEVGQRAREGRRGDPVAGGGGAA